MSLIQASFEISLNLSMRHWRNMINSILVVVEILSRERLNNCKNRFRAYQKIMNYFLQFFSPHEEKNQCFCHILLYISKTSYGPL